MADEKIVSVTFQFQGDLPENLDQVAGKIQGLDTDAGKLFQAMTKGSSMSARGFAAQANAVNMLPGPLKGATSGFGALIQAAKAFIATPVGAVITAISVALQTLMTWFTSSADGQMEFARVSGYVSGVLGQLKEIVLKVGEAIYKAFTDPKTAIKELWETIKTNIVNRIEGVGDMFKALGKIISSGFKEGYDELTNATLKAATGVENVREKMSAYAASVHDAAMKTSELKVAEEQLARDRSEWQKRDAELEVQMEDLRSQMYSASDKERLKLAEKYKKVVAEKYSKETEFLEEQLRIKKSLNELTTNSQADYDEVNRLEAALTRLKAEEKQALRFIARQEGSILRKGDGADSELKEAQERLSKQRNLQHEWVRNQLELEQKEIDLLNESFYKKQKQAELNHRKELAEIEKQRDEKLKAKREAFGQKATLSDEEEKYFKDLVSLAEKAYKKSSDEIVAAVNGAFQEGRLRFSDELSVQLADIENYYKERLRMAENNEKLIAELQAAKAKEIALARNNYTAEMLDYDIEITRKRLENAKNFYKWEADKRKAEILAERAHLKERIRLMEEQYRIAPTDRLKKEIELARLELEKFNQELKRIPAQKLAEVTGAFAQITGALGGIEGEIGQVFSQLSSSLSSISSTISADMSTIQGQAGAASTAIAGTVTLINMITSAAARRRAAEKEFYKNSIAFAHEYALSLNEQLRLQGKSGSFVRNYSKEIQGSFKALDHATKKFQESLTKLNEGKARVGLRDAIDWGNVGKGAAVGAAAGVATGALVGAAVGSVVPGIGTAIGAVVGVIGGAIAGLFSKKKKDVKAGLLEEFPDLITQAGGFNKELAQSLITTEQVDDKTKQILQNAIEWQEAIEKAEESLKEIVTDLAGDIGNNLRNAIVGAWKAGENASQRMFEVASDSLENFITQLLYSAIFSDVFEDFKNNLVESLKPTGDQDILDDFDKLMTEMDKRDDKYVELLDKVKKRAKDRGFKNFGETKENRTGASKGIQSITQETATAIEGRLTASLIYLDNITLSVGGINRTLQTGISVLTEIRDNTSHCRRLEKIEGDMGSVKRELESINSRGIIIRTA